MTITGSARRDGISIAVSPGGALRSLELDRAALRLGGARLAETILAVVREATAQANRQAQYAMRDELGGLTANELATLGVSQDDSLTEAATPDSWRA